jgi:Transposase zinc-binding domain
MNAPELGDIFRIHGPAYFKAFGDSLSGGQRKALRDIAACRTAALGGYAKQCDRCDYQAIAYRSCRNRHCPKCQGAARAAWLDQRAAELLPAEYFHVVFTLPQMVAPLASRTSGSCTGCSFAPRPKPSCKSPPVPSI